MKKITSLIMVSATLFLTSCLCDKHTLKGEGSVVTDTRSLSPITALQAEGDCRVEVIPASYNQVVISGYENLVPAFESAVSNQKLTLKFKSDYWNISNNNIHVKVYTTAIGKLSLNGSGNISLRSGFSGSNISADVNGSGSIYISPGHFNTLHADINGSGYINAKDADADNVFAKVSGSGDIDLWANNYLEARVWGSGTIDYWGNTKDVDWEVSGSGKVRRH